MKLLKTIDLAIEAPRAILPEHKHLSNHDKVELVGSLRKHGYSVDQGDGDDFAVLKKSPLPRIAKDLRARVS